ncbi:hypothetical protein [Arsenophonus sp. PmNCSU2021_1]|uniref:hypothetical protein n=1 Tax=Arsenophonus sp. PmNCSU2021_1 TaxID=3118989 RepID=UPI003FA5F392
MLDREMRCYSGKIRTEQQDAQPSRIIGYGSVFNTSFAPIKKRSIFKFNSA